jgi:hypothetical protein
VAQGETFHVTKPAPFAHLPIELITEMSFAEEFVHKVTKHEEVEPQIHLPEDKA